MNLTIKTTMSILIISIVLIGSGWASPSNSSKDNLIEDDYNLPDYGSNTFESLKEDSNVIDIRGTVPEITDDMEKIEWLSTLETSIRNSQDKLHPYMKENGGPLVGFGYSFDGYVFVDIDEELENTIDKSTIDHLYEIIDNNGEKIDVSNTPVVFTKATIELTSRTDSWTNLIGGIQLQRTNQTNLSEAYPSTLSFAAEDSNGTRGFVMCGHAAANAGGVGAAIYQPTISRQVGEVDYLTCHFADAAWVEASNVVDDIYYNDINVVKDVMDYYDANNGSKVYISGITTGLTSGYIDRDYIEINHQTFGTLYDQYRADYTATFGDSGAPVFTKYGSAVKIVGVHWGIDDQGNSYFSPISGVILDLDVTPLY